MKHALVIGGGSDIGSAVVRALIADGWNVTWTYFNTFRDQPGTGIRCDLRDLAQVESLFCLVSELDLVVTAAIPFLEADNLDFAGYLAIEPFLRAHVYAMTVGAKSAMRPDGRIVNMLGQCVERGLPGGAFYSGAFAYLHNLGQSINGREGKAGGISVCDILLGPVDTREWNGLSADVVERYRAKVRQFITVAQVADTVRFLAGQPVMPSTFKLDAYYGN